MSQQPPYQQPGQSGQPGQPGQPGGYPPPPGSPGYQGGYQQPGQPAGYGSYQSSPAQYGRSGGGNPLSTAAGLAPILQILAYVVAGLGILAGILSFTLDAVNGTYKFQQFLLDVMFGLAFGGVLLALSALLKTRDSS